jgi:hypothetical protein
LSSHCAELVRSLGGRVASPLAERAPLTLGRCQQSFRTCCERVAHFETGWLSVSWWGSPHRVASRRAKALPGSAGGGGAWSRVAERCSRPRPVTRRL